ncbi:MAG: alpha/beta hydrolase [Chitinophagaceae bacterium]
MIISGSYVTAFSQKKVIPLYKDAIPNSRKTVNEETSKYIEDSVFNISNVSRPTLTIYLPSKEKATGIAVIIYPGGGYWVVSAGHEGADVARRFNEMGIAAFVVKYRLPDNKTMINKEIGPLQDAQQAIDMVRSHAKKWHINKNKIGVLGFSAGAHLAATAGTYFKTSYINNKSRINLRPDFMILVYPVISFTDSIGHIGSRNQLIGKNPSEEKIKEYSNELNVTPETPPTFLVHAKDDNAVSVKNSLEFASALKKNNVPVKVSLFEKGGHGFGINNKSSSVKWIDLAEPWIKGLK